jgi:hypothetical protein
VTQGAQQSDGAERVPSERRAVSVLRRSGAQLLQKETAMATKKTAKKKADPTPKVYANFGQLLTAKDKGTLPRGVKAEIVFNDIIFKDGKGNAVLFIDTDTFAKGELKRHRIRTAES